MEQIRQESKTKQINKTNNMDNINKGNYPERIKLLRQKKLEQTKVKTETEGGLDEDDYGRVVPPADFAWQLMPNHANGSFYGYQGWSDNFRRLLTVHPVFVDPHDAFTGKWMFFLSRMKGPIWNPDYDYSYLRPAQEKYNIIHGIGGDAHFAPDYRIGLSLGWEGLRNKLKKYREINRNDEFYDAEEKTIAGIQAWIRATIRQIDEMIPAEDDPVLQDNLKEMSRVNRRVISDPPRTLREACQWLCWFNMASRTYNRDGAGGQLDELLRPYYENDLKNGILDDDEARFYLACLLLNDTHYYQLGGPDENGKDMVSHLSFLILEAADLINTSCNLTIRVHEGLNREFFLKSVRYLFTNKNGWPRYSGDKALVEGFVKCGFSPELARKRIAVGCNWMSLPGLEYTLNDLVKVNVARVFEIALDEMMDMMDMMDISKETGGTNEPSTELLWNLFEKHLEQAVGTAAEGMAFHLKYQVDNEPELVLNLLSHGPVEKGLDVSAGGARYYNLAIDGAGIAVAADSFGALAERIESERAVTWRELYQLLQNNYAGIRGEYVRQMMSKAPRYGKGHSPADQWGVRISQCFTRLVRRQCERYPDYQFIPGWFSWANTIELGRAVGATPNGRKAGEALNHGANPLPGFRPDGAVTALANTIAAIQPGYGNTAPIQLEFDPGLAGDEEAVTKIADFIKTAFDRGATLLNINIIDREKILAAHADPSKYPDLVVRVTGFTAYFAMLSREFRQLVVDRIIS